MLAFAVVAGLAVVLGWLLMGWAMAHDPCSSPTCIDDGLVTTVSALLALVGILCIVASEYVSRWLLTVLAGMVAFTAAFVVSLHFTDWSLMYAIILTVACVAVITAVYSRSERRRREAQTATGADTP
jgi:hypothetical protein